MTKVRAILTSLIIVSNLFIFSGCWDLREINELGLVTAVGIDKGSGQNRYSVTVQIANPSTSNSSDNKGSVKSEAWVGTAEGESLFDATRKLVNISSRRIMWAHNNMIIIGESLAREGIIPVVDYFTHNPELRMKAAVAVSKGDAKDYITARVGMESVSGVSYVLLESYRATIGESVESHMLEVSSALKSEYGNPIISGIGLKKAIMQSQTQDNQEKTSNTVELSGTAVFKKDKMLGWLTSQESLGLSWILNQTQNAIVTISTPVYNNKSVSVETEGVKTKIKSEVVNGEPRISIYVHGKGDIVEEDSSTNLSMDYVKKNIENLVNEKIESEIKNSLDVIQNKYGVDILGFSTFVHVQNDKEWHNGLMNRWDDVFPKIPVSVTANIDIKSSTLNQEPMIIY